MIIRSFGLVLVLLTVLLMAASIGFAQKAPKVDLSTLVGTWKVDLRSTPDAAEYFQEFVITKIDGKTFSGTFYGAEIKNGKVNSDWETVYLAFTSEDQSGIYSHFAGLSGNKLIGATNSLGRNFLLPWRAEKKIVIQAGTKTDIKAKNDRETMTNAVRTEMNWDVEKIRKDFPVLHREVNGKPLVYLDNGASSQVPQSVIDRTSKYLSEEHSNVHRGVHYLSQHATTAYEAAREKVKRFINAKEAKECIFVRGTTEGINLVAHSYGRKVY